MKSLVNVTVNHGPFGFRVISDRNHSHSPLSAQLSANDLCCSTKLWICHVWQFTGQLTADQKREFATHMYLLKQLTPDCCLNFMWTFGCLLAKQENTWSSRSAKLPNANIT